MRVETKHHPKTSRDNSQTRYLVAGREGSLALGNLLNTLFRSKKLAVEEIISFDHSRSLTLYEIQILGSGLHERGTEVDLMICLNDAALDYEPMVRRSGTLIVDANSVTRRPKRIDIDIVAVPSFNLVQDISERLSEETRTRLNLSLSSLLGSIEAIESDYPDSETLKRLFEKLQVEQSGLFLMAVYRGYDWLQETRMRGKTAWGGVLN